MGGGAGPEGSKKISQALTGKPKSAKHIENLKGKNLGKRYSPEINRKKARPGKLNGIYGIKRPEIMAIANAASVAKSKGKTYEEIYGAEKAQELKKIKSIKLKEYLKNNPNSRLKYYKIISPEGTIYTIVGNLEKFCKEHKIYSGKMYDVLKGRLESYNGWKVSVV